MSLARDSIVQVVYSVFLILCLLVNPCLANLPVSINQAPSDFSWLEVNPTSSKHGQSLQAHREYERGNTRHALDTPIFDKLYRLKSETITGATTNNGAISYTHDKVGNRLSRTSSVATVPSQNQSYTANDHLTGDTMDDNGNTLSSPLLPSSHGADHTGTFTDTYDFRNKLVQRVYTGGKTIVLSYDADGNRVSKVVLDGVSEIREHHYLVDTNNHTGYAQVAEERDGSGFLTRVNHYGHDLVSTSFITEGYQRYYQYDGLGSVRALSDDNGDVTDEYTYDAFGILIDTTGTTANQYRYTGEQWDADLGMYFLRARYNNVQTGRFHNMDTYEGRNGEPMTLHKYLYGHANPVSYIDPSGNAGLSSMSASIGMATLRLFAPSYTMRMVGSRIVVGAVFAIVKNLYSNHYFPKLYMELNSLRQSVVNDPSKFIAVSQAIHGLKQFESDFRYTSSAWALFFSQFGLHVSASVIYGTLVKVNETVLSTLQTVSFAFNVNLTYEIDHLKAGYNLLSRNAEPDSIVRQLSVINATHGKSDVLSLFHHDIAINNMQYELSKYGEGTVTDY
ncbi:MAG: RHS repeat-associated core domain-containing protein [Akkermansiaceae bacterium]